MQEHSSCPQCDNADTKRELVIVSMLAKHASGTRIFKGRADSCVENIDSMCADCKTVLWTNDSLSEQPPCDVDEWVIGERCSHCDETSILETVVEERFVTWSGEHIEGRTTETICYTCTECSSVLHSKERPKYIKQLEEGRATEEIDSMNKTLKSFCES